MSCESMGDSRARGTALASRTFTIARDGGVTSAGVGAEGRAGPLGAEPRAAAKVDVYTRKLRKRLRDGVKRRGGGGWKVAPVSASVAALVTKEAVADIFPTGLPPRQPRHAAHLAAAHRQPTVEPACRARRARLSSPPCPPRPLRIVYAFSLRLLV